VKVGCFRGLRIADWGLGIGDWGLRITDCGLGIADCGLGIADCGLRITDFLSIISLKQSQESFVNLLAWLLTKVCRQINRH